jgi:16S rRNA (guanine1207-N2)-methyltransferase
MGEATVCVYGSPPSGLIEVPPEAVQVSPLVPGAGSLEELAEAGLDSALVAAPPGTIERRYVLARALQAVRPSAALTALAPRDKGGARLRKELEAFGCGVTETSRHHQRICRAVRPETPVGLDAAIAAGALQFSSALGLWTQPGVFSWDRPDPGTQRLVAALPALAGRGADLGCGLGELARCALARPAVTRLDLVDIDRRAVAAARRNVADPRAHTHWADARLSPDLAELDLAELDFVVMNPPFHDHGVEDRELGEAFIRRARQILRAGGTLWIVANRHLPYEAVLNELFAEVALKGEDRSFKVCEARR